METGWRVLATWSCVVLEESMEVGTQSATSSVPYLCSDEHNRLPTGNRQFASL